MKVSLDNGRTYKEIDNVRIIYDDLLNPYEGDCFLHVNATGEGLIMDVWNEEDRHAMVSESVATSSETAQEIVERLTD
jgi:hypothetical protein